MRKCLFWKINRVIQKEIKPDNRFESITFIAIFKLGNK